MLLQSDGVVCVCKLRGYMISHENVKVSKYEALHASLCPSKYSVYLGSVDLCRHYTSKDYKSPISNRRVDSSIFVCVSMLGYVGWL